MDNKKELALTVLYDALERIVQEFDSFGEVLQEGMDSFDYGPNSAIGQARSALESAQRVMGQGGTR